MCRDRPASLAISLFHLRRLGDESNVAHAAGSHYREHFHDGAIGNLVVGAQINATASPPVGERLEAGAELREAETRLVDKDCAPAIDGHGEPALRLERTRLCLWQRDVDTSLHHRRGDHEDDHEQHHHVDEAHDIDLRVEHEAVAAT